MSKETENQEKHPEPANQVEVKRADTTDLERVVDGADVSYDTLSKVKDLRSKVKDIRTKKGPYGRIEKRELLQEATCELIKAEKAYIVSEAKKATKLIDTERMAWMITLQKAWVAFLRKTGTETIVDKHSFVQELMGYSSAKRREVESKTDISQKQKDRFLDIIDKDEDGMIAQVEKMADDIINAQPN